MKAENSLRGLLYPNFRTQSGVVILFLLLINSCTNNRALAGSALPEERETGPFHGLDSTLLHSSASRDVISRLKEMSRGLQSGTPRAGNSPGITIGGKSNIMGNSQLQQHPFGVPARPMA